MYNENELSLTEATVLALQGKLKLEETKPTRKSRKTIKKEESVNINTDEVNVSVDDNGDTIVDTDNKTITVSEKVTENPPIEEPTENQETIDVPVEGDEAIVPEEEVSEETVEDIIDEPNEDIENIEDEDIEDEDIENIEDLELDESKKVENKNGFSNKVKTEAIEDKEETKCENCGKEVCECDTIEQPIEESKECLVEEEPKYEWVLQGNYGYGWDDLVTYDSKEEAEADYKDYRENEPEYAHRIRKRVVKEEVKNELKDVKEENKEVKIESKPTFNKKSFEEALTKFYKFNSDKVESFKVESISKNKKESIKIEGKLNNKVDTIMIFDKLTEGNSYVTYKLRNTNGILKESKDIVTSMFISKKFNNLNCRRIISK